MWKIEYDKAILESVNCQKKKLVGYGAFGRVYLVSSKNFGIICAKIIKFGDYDEREYINLEKFKSSSCPHIVKTYGFIFMFFLFSK
jgi:hypothetical protein